MAHQGGETPHFKVDGLCTLENTGKHVFAKPAFMKITLGWFIRKPNTTKRGIAATPQGMRLGNRWENPLFLTNPDFRKIVWVTWVSLQNVGFFHSPEMCTLERTGQTSIFAKPAFRKKSWRLHPRVHQKAEHYKTCFFAIPGDVHVGKHWKISISAEPAFTKIVGVR